MKPQTARSTNPRSLLSAAAISTLLHAALAGLAMLLLRGCSLGNPGLAGGEKFRDVGLFVVDGSDSGLADVTTNPGEGPDQVSLPHQSKINETQQNLDSNQQLPGLTDSPRQIPNLDGLLNNQSQNDGSNAQNSKLPDLIGPGNLRANQSGGSAGNSGSPIQPSTAGGARKSGGLGGQGETTFMNIVGAGRSFVYVIDTSSSMDGPRLRQAKSQLKASLRLLQPNQQFAVIFYNEINRRLRLRRQAEQPLYFATEVNQQLAAQEIDSVISDAGTDHRPALLEALAARPDVVYFLTDGDDPPLSKADLKDIRHAANTTTIHVIRFGDGIWNRSSDNWLQQLAAQNQGEYRELSVPAN